MKPTHSRHKLLKLDLKILACFVFLAMVFFILLICTISCEKEYHNPQAERNQFVGEWQMYLIAGIDTVWSKYYYTLNRDGSGFEQLAGCYVWHLTWSSTDELFEVVWEDGSAYIYPYTFIDPLLPR